MRIAMVYPQYPDTFFSFKYALNLISKKAMYPPLGLLTVAAMLPVEWEKKLIDMNVTGLTDKDILWADYVFISAMQVQSNSVKEVITTAESVMGKEIKKIITERRQGDPASLVADNKKAKEVLNWIPQYNIRDIIQSAWNWHNNPKY